VPLSILASAAGLGLLRLAWPDAQTPTWTFKPLLEVGVLGVASLAMAYVLWDHGMRRGNHLLLSLASYFVPIVSIALASAYLGVMPGPSLLVGCALVVAGALVCKASLSDRTK
jgi:drug/metabolite transporter (DMT)-like permease